MPTVTWDDTFEASPADTDEAKYGATKIRQLKVAVRERLELELEFKTGTQPLLKAGKAAVIFYGTTAEITALTGMSKYAFAYDTETMDLKYYDGSDWQIVSRDFSVVVMTEQESDPSESADKGKLYTKEVDYGDSEVETELFYRSDVAGHILQLTRKGEHELLAVGDRLIFPQNSAPLGFILIDTLDDKLVYITKGKDFGSGADGGSPGGEDLCASFAFDAGSYAEDLQEYDTIQRTAGGAGQWSCRLRSIEISGSPPNQTGRLYYDQLAGGTPADDDAINDTNGRNFEADVNGLNRPACAWTISGLTKDAHTHSIGSLTLDQETVTSRQVSGKAAVIDNYLHGGGTGYWSDKTVHPYTNSSNTGAQSDAGITHNGEWRPKSHTAIIAEKT